MICFTIRNLVAKKAVKTLVSMVYIGPSALTIAEKAAILQSVAFRECQHIPPIIVQCCTVRILSFKITLFFSCHLRCLRCLSNLLIFTNRPTFDSAYFSGDTAFFLCVFLYYWMSADVH